MHLNALFNLTQSIRTEIVLLWATHVEIEKDIAVLALMMMADE